MPTASMRQPIDVVSIQEYIATHVPEIHLPIEISQVLSIVVQSSHAQYHANLLLDQFGFGQSNPTYRKDGGKTGHGDDTAAPRELPTWLVLYEFDSPPDRRELILHRQTECSKKIMMNVTLETGIYKMETFVGDRDIAL
jgi:hypothetical protein